MRAYRPLTGGKFREEFLMFKWQELAVSYRPGGVGAKIYAKVKINRGKGLYR